MIRLICAAVLAAGIGGCKASDARVPIDPFYGQTKIPPPGTGQISQRPPVDPYYPYHPPQASTGAFQEHPALATLSSDPGTDPAGSAADLAVQRRPGDRIAIPDPARQEFAPAVQVSSSTGRNSPAFAGPPAPPAVAASSAAASADPLAGKERIVQTVVPREGSVSRSPAAYAPPGIGRAGRAHTEMPVDIMDLPSVGSGAAVIRDSQVRLATATDADSAGAVRIPTVAATVAEGTRQSPDPLGRYGYSTDYRRLRGRLEYLERQQCWKLRYIPIDGTTDKFGGSVVLEDATVLSGFERGDFVEVRGELAELSQNSTDFAPPYLVAEIRSLAN